MQDALGVKGEGTWTQPDAEQERPYPVADVRPKRSLYKPTVKWDQTGRESEGPVVPTTPADNAGGGKGPCFDQACVRG
jgi:hypothetical protein